MGLLGAVVLYALVLFVGHAPASRYRGRILVIGLLAGILADLSLRWLEWYWGLASLGVVAFATWAALVRFLTIPPRRAAATIALYLAYSAAATYVVVWTRGAAA
jgi:hypothetical protein